MFARTVSYAPSILKTANKLRTSQRGLATIHNFQDWRASVTHPRNMATPSKIQLTVNDTGIVKNKPQNEDTAMRTSELLQENHDKHHILFNQSGYHNHIAHHLLSLYGLGAPTSVIERQYAANVSYQRPAKSPKTEPIDLTNPSTFTSSLGNQKNYHSFLLFFQSEMKLKGWQPVLNEYLFAGTEKAEDLLGRLFAGFLHPLIHLGFGIEFNQPAIMAEALAQAAIHDTWTGAFLFSLEKAATSESTPVSKTMPEILTAIHTDKVLSTAANWKDSNKIRDGLLVRAPKEMTSHALAWQPTVLTLEQKTVEMINSTVYFTACAQHPPKQVKFDFYYMHCVNCSIFFPTFNSQTWLSAENKLRLLKWKGWMDLTMYASRRAPPLLLSEIETYVPASHGDQEKTSWHGIFQRLFDLPDDGHAAKLGRAVRNAELRTEESMSDGGKEEGLVIRGEMWEKIGNMVIDSVEDTGAPWVQSTGFEEAWEKYGDRKTHPQL